MTDDIAKKFRELAARVEAEVAGHADVPDTAVVLDDEIEQMAHNLTRIPIDDIDGITLKVAIYAYFRGLVPSDPDQVEVPEKLLFSALNDLLRRSREFAWLRSRPRQ